MALPKWNTKAFGCLIRDEVQLTSLLRTQLSASLPVPFVSRYADASAPVELDFVIDMTNDEFTSWEQWFTYDLNDGALPFTMFLPWGPEQPQVTCRFIANWDAQKAEDQMRWSVSGRVQIERESLPLWSGGAR